jgi:hypothetical protein
LNNYDFKFRIKRREETVPDTDGSHRAGAATSRDAKSTQKDFDVLLLTRRERVFTRMRTELVLYGRM